MEEKDAVMRHFQELKGRMNRFRQLQSRRLTELTVNARNAQKVLASFSLLWHIQILYLYIHFRSCKRK